MASFCVIFKTIECDCCHTDNVKYFSVNLIFFLYFFLLKPNLFSSSLIHRKYRMKMESDGENSTEGRLNETKWFCNFNLAWIRFSREDYIKAMLNEVGFELKLYWMYVSAAKDVLFRLWFMGWRILLFGNMS